MFHFQEMEKLGFFNSDLPHNVLSRLPTKTLLGLKCVSKGWHKVISERSFIQDQLQKHKPIVSGFIFQGKYQWCNEDIKIVSYIPVESKVSQVQQMVFDFLPEVVVILASCNGLVCCRSCFPAQDPAIYVCNPSNKQWIRLNSATPDQHSTIGLVFDPARDPVNISTKFKLVRVKQLKIEEKEEEELYYTFEVYSLETGTWTKSNEICHCNSNLVKNKSVYVGGILHWQTNGDKVLTYHVENELSWLISVPVPATEFNTIPEACIGDSEGKLHYVMISEEGLHIWFLEDYFEIQWTLKYSKSLLEIEEEHPRFYNLHERVTQRVTYDMDPWMVPLAFKDGLLLMRVSAKLYLYHIETGMMKEACTLAKLGPNSMYCPVVLPYSMSLVPLNRA
jgi:hypothetical protein